MMTFTFPDPNSFGAVETINTGEGEPRRFVFSPSIYSEILSAIVEEDTKDGPSVELCPTTIIDWSTKDSVVSSYYKVEEECIEPGWYTPGWHKIDDIEINMLRLEGILRKQIDADKDEMRDIVIATCAACCESPLMAETVLYMLYQEIIPVQFAELLRRVWDIRRFIDPAAPLRGGKLKSWLCVDRPDAFCRKLNLAAVPALSDLPTPIIAHDTWNTSYASGPVGSFFFERCNAHLASAKKGKLDPRRLALWKTTVDLVNLLRLVWLDWLGLLELSRDKFFGKYAAVLDFIENSAEYGLEDEEDAE